MQCWIQRSVNQETGMKTLSTLKMLVVDDQPIIDEFCRKVLANLGCQKVLSALSGCEAIEILTREPDVDLVLTDIDMQPGNGLELLQAVRCGDIPKVPRDLCVLMITDYNYRNNVMSAVGLDCNGFVSKPLSLDLLRDKIDAARRRRIELVDIAVYRSISTEVSTAKGINKPGTSYLQPTAQPPANPHTTAPPASAAGSAVSTTVTPAVEPAPLQHNDANTLQLVMAELVSDQNPDPFLQYKQKQLSEILRQLEDLLREINYGSEDQAIHMTHTLEQVSAELFGQEYQNQREHHYNHLSAHQAEHGMILQRTQILAKKIQQKKKPNVLMAYNQLLQAWHLHISGKDRQYAHFLTHGE